MDFEILQNWLPGLTRHRLKIARHHRILQGRGSVVSAVSSILFWKLSYFKCTNKKNVNNVCFNSRKVTFKTAEITLILSFIKKALWNNARAGQDYPRAANYWKFYRVKMERKHVHNFFVKTSFDLIMPTSRSNENLQRGYQLQGSHAPWKSLKVLESQNKNSRPWKSLKIVVSAGKSLKFVANLIQLRF